MGPFIKVQTQRKTTLYAYSFGKAKGESNTVVVTKIRLEMVWAEELLRTWQFILLRSCKHVRPTHCSAHDLKTYMKSYNACPKNESRTRMHLNGVNSQHDKETGLRNSRDPYALVNWRPPSLTSSKVFGGEGAPGRNRRLSSARPNPPPATETRPRQRLHLRPATRGRLGRFRAERRLPGEGGARSPPSRPGARPRSPTAPSPRRARPRQASAGAWSRHTLAAGGGVGGARTSSRRRRNYRASPFDRTEFISGDCLATPLGQPPAAPEARVPASAHAQCEAPGREQHHRPPSQGPAGARAHAQGDGCRERVPRGGAERACAVALGLRLARGGARAGGRGRAMSGARRKRARGPEHGKEGPVTVRSSCQRPRLGSGRTEEKVRQTPVRCPTFRTQSRAEQPRLLVGRGGAAATSGRCLTWSPWSGWSCARACSLGYVLGRRAGGKTPQPFPPRTPVLVPRGQRPGRPAVTSGAWVGRS